MREIKHNKDFTMICEIDENGNMIDITDKCPIELCQNFNKIMNGQLEINPKHLIYNLGGERNNSRDEQELQDVYYYLVEKTHKTPSWTQQVDFKPIPHMKLQIAFNRYFYNYVYGIPYNK